MSFIRMSPEFITSTVTYFTMLGQSGSNQLDMTIAGRGMLVSHSSQAATHGARLAIMSGAVPTSFTGLTFQSRLADVLITYDASAGTSSTNSNEFTGSLTNVNPMVINTIYVNASASGTATWFWWFTSPLSNANGFTWNNTVAYNQIIGTVGVTGSGADLTIPSVNIEQGLPYRIYDYRLQIPTQWTF